jgi:ubiquinone/menaquinone biosynthesis C-methylase UbiE
MTCVDETKFVTNVYDTIAEHFNDKRQARWYWIDDFIETTKKGDHVLDIGCGGGRNMKYSERAFKGIDSSTKFVELCLSQGLDVILGSMISLPFYDSAFDHLISIASFHHLSTEESRLKCLGEMYRILKPGGRVLLSVWSKNQQVGSKRQFTYGDNYVPWITTQLYGSGQTYQRYYYIFDLDELKRLVTQSGFNIVNVSWDYGNEVLILQK